MKKVISLFLGLLMVTGVFASCKNNEQTKSTTNGGYTFKDSLGNNVTVNKPKRVVALMGSFAEIWTLAGGSLVGTSDDTFSEKKLKLDSSVKSVGNYNAPNSEAILALNPDLVLLSSETQQHVALADTFKNAGVEAAYFNVTYFKDYLNMLKICCDITGNKSKYEENGTKVKEQVDSIIAKAKDSKKKNPKILLMITYSRGVIVKNSSCQAGEILKDLMSENVADKSPSMLKEFSVEKVIEENPDYIFVIPMGNSDELAKKNLKTSVESNPAWKDLDAVKNDRYIMLPKELFLYKPNAEWGKAYEYLYNIIYK